MKSNTKKVLSIFINLLGFPLLILCVALNASHVIKQGKSYGIFAYAGIILTVALALVYYLTMWHMRARKKKSPIKQGIILAIIGTFALSGLWVVIENLAPNKLLSATSSTIYMEDLMEEYDEKADVHKKLLNDFIKLNCYNDNLVYTNSVTDEKDSNFVIFDKKTDKNPKGKNIRLNTAMESLKDDKAKYEEELIKWNIARMYCYEKYSALGYKSKEVQTLATKTFGSIDGDGYGTFRGPWIDMAIGGRLTVPALVHLMLDHRTFQNKDMPTVTKDGVGIKPVKWCVLDMMGPPLGLSEMDFKDELKAQLSVEKDENKKAKLRERIKEARYNNVMEVPAMAMPLKDILGDERIKKLIKNPETITGNTKLVNALLSVVENFIQHEKVVGSPIYVGIDTDNGELHLISANAKRGTLGYQNAAWFNSNNLIFMLASVFSTRKLYLIFSGIICLVSIATGVLKQGKLKSEVEFENRMKEALNMSSEDNADDALEGKAVDMFDEQEDMYNKELEAKVDDSDTTDMLDENEEIYYEALDGDDNGTYNDDVVGVHEEVAVIEQKDNDLSSVEKTADEQKDTEDEWLNSLLVD